MYTCHITNLFKHEFSQSPDLLAILWVIHNVVLHEEGLRGDKKNRTSVMHTPGAEAVALQWYLNPRWADTLN